jgi:hypothetical protein
VSAFCPSTRNDKPQELPSEAALGAWFNWCLWSGLGSSDDSNLNGIQEVFRSILGRQAL